MRARFDAKLNMLRTVAKLYELEQPRFDVIPIFPILYAPYAAYLVEIEPWVEIAISDPTVDAAIVAGYKKALADSAEDVAHSVGVYASFTGNMTLKNIMNVQAYTLVKEKKDRLLAICQTIHDEAAAIKEAAKDYGLSSQKLETLASAISTYQAAANLPRIAHGKLSTANVEIDRIITACEVILKEQLDRLVDTLASSDAPLVGLWKTARTIIDPVTDHTTFTVTVKTVAAEPIEGALVVLRKLEQEKSLETDKSGKAMWPTIGPGEWAVSVTKLGFQAYFKADFKVVIREDNTLDITLLAA